MALKKRQVTPLSVRASFQPGSANEEKRTVDVVWTTGAKVLRSSWIDGQFNEELSLDPKHVRMGRLNNGAPFLANHDGQRLAAVLGVVESARIEGNKGVATVRFARAEDDPEADKIYRKVVDGIIQNISVGYRVHKFEKVEGGDEKVPTFRAVDWEPYEISAVPMGADDGAGFRSAPELNECEFYQRGSPHNEGIKMTEEEIKRAAEEKAALAKREAELKAVAAKAAQDERERSAGINHAVRAAGLEQTVAQKMIDDGTTLEAARATVLESLAKRTEETPIDTHVRVTDDSKDKFFRGVSAWLIERSGKGVVEAAKRKNLQGFENVELNGGEFRGMSLTDLARKCLSMAGVKHEGIYDRNQLFKLALRGGGYSGTSDFSVLFENVMYKTMRAAYATQADTWRRFCGTETVSDFREANRFLNGSFGTLDVVAENGEYQNKAIPDGAKTTISTQTYGALISISRQALINDDMGALADLAVRFGRSAGLSIESAVYALLAENTGAGPTMDDSHPFFYSGRSNISNSAALSVAALDADKVKMRQQMDISSNEYLDLNPSILLIPVGLESAAKVLNSSAWDHTSTNNQKPNPVQGMFADIVSSPRLTASTTRRYLFTAGKEAFKVVFLEGAGEGPTMESEQGFDTDGMRWKARVDFKAVPYDPKTAITNAGT